MHGAYLMEQLKGGEVKWSNPQYIAIALPKHKDAFQELAAESLRFFILESCVHRVCTFFIAFLYNSYNFQYLILG